MNIYMYHMGYPRGSNKGMLILTRYFDLFDYLDPRDDKLSELEYAYLFQDKSIYP